MKLLPLKAHGLEVVYRGCWNLFHRFVNAIVGSTPIALALSRVLLLYRLKPYKKVHDLVMVIFLLRLVYLFLNFFALLRLSGISRDAIAPRHLIVGRWCDTSVRYVILDLRAVHTISDSFILHHLKPLDSELLSLKIRKVCGACLLLLLAVHES